VAGGAASLGAVEDESGLPIGGKKALQVFICDRRGSGDVVAPVDLGLVDVDEEDAGLAIKIAGFP
jgi:hypothetical protein